MRGSEVKVLGARGLIWIGHGARLGQGKEFPSHCHASVLMASWLSSRLLCGLVFKPCLPDREEVASGSWGRLLGTLSQCYCSSWAWHFRGAYAKFSVQTLEWRVFLVNVLGISKSFFQVLDVFPLTFFMLSTSYVGGWLTVVCKEMFSFLLHLLSCVYRSFPQVILPIETIKSFVSLLV